MEPNWSLSSRIYLAGHTGLVGAALHRLLVKAGYRNLILRTHGELDLRDQAATTAFFAQTRPEFVFCCAARVGGILANSTLPAQFIYDNLAINTNLIHCAYTHDAQKLMFLGSTCIYPRLAPQPLHEEYLLTGELEPTNTPYAIAKIAGIQMLAAYRRQYGFRSLSLMPTNLYGPGDNFHPEHSHVLPALLRKFDHAARHGERSVTVWGTGSPRREFLFVDDLADAMLFLMQHHDFDGIANVGHGKDIPIRELTQILAQVTGFRGDILFDPSKPDGTPRKLVATSKLDALGWRAQVSLEDGLMRTYEWFQKNRATLKA